MEKLDFCGFGGKNSTHFQLGQENSNFTVLEEKLNFSILARFRWESSILGFGRTRDFMVLAEKFNFCGLAGKLDFWFFAENYLLRFW